MNEQHLHAGQDPFEIFENAPEAEPAPRYSLSVTSIKGGPKGDMDKEDV